MSEGEPKVLGLESQKADQRVCLLTTAAVNHLDVIVNNEGSDNDYY
jgi:hypothetical protein